MNTIHAVIVHHHGREMLGECLESLVNSIQVDLHVIVVLNGCDEALPDIAERHERIHHVAAPEPLGFSAANNLGVSWARENLGQCSSYYFINNDTVSQPDALRVLSSVFVNHPEIGASGPRLLIQWAPHHLNSLGLNLCEDGWGWDEGIGMSMSEYGPMPPLRQVLALTGSALLVTSEAFTEVGGWTELYDYYFEDLDLCLKLKRAGWGIANEPAAIVYHAVSKTTGLDSEWKVFLFWRNRLLLTMVHWPFFFWLRKVFPVVFIDEIIAPLWQDSRLQRRALLSALRRLPRALRIRLGLKGRHREWISMLRPAGTVPVITLPEAPPDGGGIDRSGGGESETGEDLDNEIDVLRRERDRLAAEKVHLEGENRHLKEHLKSIYISPMWRTWAVLRRVKAILSYPWRKLRGRTGG